MNSFYLPALRAVMARYPAIVPHLTGRARWIASMGSGEYKTYDYFLHELERMIRNVYNGNLGGEFIDIMANLISGQFSQASQQAWMDEGTDEPYPAFLNQYTEQAILYQYDYVDRLYRDIVDARVDGKPLDPLLARAPLWANRWTETYNGAVALIVQELGGNLIWKLGQTEQHCPTCAALNGIVARASEWDALNVKPQNAPNALLVCGGWQCDCSLEPTDKRRSPKAFERIMDAVGK